MLLIDILLPEYDREIATTRAVIDAAHELDLSWRPDARARTLGELVTHLADIAAWTSIVMTREGYDVTDRPDTRQSRALATVLERFDTSASAGRTALAGRSDGELTIALFPAGQLGDPRLDAGTTRPPHLHASPRLGVPGARAEPPHPSPGPAQRVSADARGTGPVDLRCHRERLDGYLVGYTSCPDARDLAPTGPAKPAGGTAEALAKADWLL